MINYFPINGISFNMNIKEYRNVSLSVKRVPHCTTSVAIMDYQEMQLLMLYVKVCIYFILRLGIQIH